MAGARRLEPLRSATVRVRKRGARRVGSGGSNAARGSDSITRRSSLSSPQMCSARSLPAIAPLVIGAASHDISTALRLAPRRNPGMGEQEEHAADAEAGVEEPPPVVAAEAVRRPQPFARVEQERANAEREQQIAAPLLPRVVEPQTLEERRPKVSGTRTRGARSVAAAVRPPAAESQASGFRKRAGRDRGAARRTSSAITLRYRVRVPVGDLPYQGVEEVIEPS